MLAVTMVFGIAATSPTVAQQVLKVGATPTGAPFAFLDTKTNTIQGVMVDILAEMGKEMGVTFEIQSMQFTSLIPSLTAKKLDLVAAPMLITPSRKEVVNFSTPIYTYGEALIVPKTDATDYTKLDELKGAAVGGQIGGVYIDTLNKSGLFSDVKAYDTFVDVVRDGNCSPRLGDYVGLGWRCQGAT
jgi:polar amino acid transport system substrate-binding protein